MEKNESPNSLKTTLNWRDNARQVLATLAPAKAKLKLGKGETAMTRQVKRAIAREMGRTLVTKAKQAKRSSAKLKRSILRRRKADERKAAPASAKKHFPGRPVEFTPRKKSKHMQIGRLFHV